MRGMIIMKIGVYVRVSTDEQRDKGYSIVGQIAKSEALIKERFEDSEYVLYDDAGYSAKNLNRPAIKQLLLDITEQQIDILIFYSLDRLSRNLNDLMYLLHHADVNKCVLNCITQDISYDTPEQRMFILMQGVFAQFEREKISERTKNGLAGGLESGNYVFSATPYGYTRINKKLTINTVETEIVKKVFYLYTQKNWSISKIFSHFNNDPSTENRLSYNVLCRMLQNTTYCGYIIYQNKKYNVVPPIINTTTFETAQVLLNTGTYSRHIQRKYKYLFKGKAICAMCERTLTGQSTLKKTRVYLYYFCNNKSCRSHKNRISEEQIIKQLESTLVALAKKFYKSNRSKIIKNLGIDNIKKELKDEIVSRKEKIYKLNQAYLDEAINKFELKELKQQYNNEIDYYKTEIGLLDDSILNTNNFKALSKEQQQKFIQQNLDKTKIDLIQKLVVL